MEAPLTIQAATQPLLELYLGRERGVDAYRTNDGKPIAADMRSGYDVRLVAELFKSGAAPDALPRSRLELYDAMLATARNPDGSAYPTADLCHVAWTCWVDGRRDLRPGQNISAQLLEPLRRQGVNIMPARTTAKAGSSATTKCAATWRLAGPR